MSKELIDAIVEMREEDALRLAKDLLDGGMAPMAILDFSRKAMETIGQRFEAGEYFVSELMLGGEIMEKIAALAKPQIAVATESKRRGKVLIGTVTGDIHDIGKQIVALMLDVNGFEVIDLGVDVPPAVFVEKIREIKPDVVGMSGLLTLSYEGMKKTVDAIREAGLRDSVKIMIGGASVDDQAQAYSGADAWGRGAMDAVTLSNTWIGGK